MFFVCRNRILSKLKANSPEYFNLGQKIDSSFYSSLPMPHPRLNIYLPKQLIIQISNGKPIKEIERNLGVSRNTVRKYRDKMEKSGKTDKELLDMPKPVLAYFLGEV